MLLEQVLLFTRLSNGTACLQQSADTVQDKQLPKILIAVADCASYS